MASTTHLDKRDFIYRKTAFSMGLSPLLGKEPKTIREPKAQVIKPTGHRKVLHLKYN